MNDRPKLQEWYGRYFLRDAEISQIDLLRAALEASATEGAQAIIDDLSITWSKEAGEILVHFENIDEFVLSFHLDEMAKAHRLNEMVEDEELQAWAEKLRRVADFISAPRSFDLNGNLENNQD